MSRTDRFFDKRKEANVFRKQIRSGPCFLRGLLSEENPSTARRAVAPCHSLLTYFCIRATCHAEALASVDLWGYFLLRCKGGDDFFKAWVAA
jgi:hypothetical protein